MSIEAVAEFTNKLAESESLQQELMSAIGDKEGLEASQAVSELGAKHGYEFTAEEAETLRQLVLASQSDELSEEQLEAVAGGGVAEDVGGVAGAAIGANLGGPVGAIIGSAVGSYVGGKIKKIFSGW